MNRSSYSAIWRTVSRYIDKAVNSEINPPAIFDNPVVLSIPYYHDSMVDLSIRRAAEHSRRIFLPPSGTHSRNNRPILQHHHDHTIVNVVLRNPSFVGNLNQIFSVADSDVVWVGIVPKLTLVWESALQSLVNSVFKISARTAACVGALQQILLRKVDLVNFVVDGPALEDKGTFAHCDRCEGPTSSACPLRLCWRYSPALPPIYCWGCGQHDFYFTQRLHQIRLLLILFLLLGSQFLKIGQHEQRPPFYMIANLLYISDCL